MSGDSSDEPFVAYLDYVCPFSYVAWVVLTDTFADLERPPPLFVEPVDTRSYKRGPDDELDHSIDDQVGDAPFERMHEKAFRVADQYDVALHDGPDRRDDGWPAHLAARFVCRAFPDRCRAFHDAVFEAKWRDGRDVSDPAVLGDLGERIGASAESVRAALDDDQLRAELRRDLAATRAADVNSAPTFVYGDRRVADVLGGRELRSFLVDWVG
jgi:predicted DsbA family dithiol-disulfide isomerase